jgi:antitoxin ParD1/3/4
MVPLKTPFGQTCGAEGLFQAHISGTAANIWGAVDGGTTFSYRTAMSVKSSISLTDEQAAFARAMVEAGRYASVSAVIQQGLELLRTKTEDEELERAALRQLLDRRRKSPFISSEEMGERLLKIAERARRKYGV